MAEINSAAEIHFQMDLFDRYEIHQPLGMLIKTKKTQINKPNEKTLQQILIKSR